MPDEDRELLIVLRELEKVCLNKESTNILIFQNITF